MVEKEPIRELSSIQFQDHKLLKHHDTCVILHLYYPEMWDEIQSYLSNLGDHFDLFVTIPYEVDISEHTLKTHFPEAQIYRCENRGRDISPFLAVFSAISELNYNYICKIHTKKSVHIINGKQWHQEMIAKLLGSPEIVARVKRAFDAHHDWGLIAPQGHVVPHTYFWAQNVTNVLNLAHSAGIPTDDIEFSFVAGSMFWFRPQAFSLLLNVDIPALNFEPEQGQLDGTLAHAFERLLGLVSNYAGYKIAESDSQGVKLTSISFHFRLLIEEFQKQEQTIQTYSSELLRQEETIRALSKGVESLTAQLVEITSSLAWSIALRITRTGLILFPRGTRREQFVRQIIQSIRNWRSHRWAGVESDTNEFLDQLPEPDSSNPVVSNAADMADKSSQRAEIVFISHEATRTGAPIFLLNLLHFLSSRLDVDFITLLRYGGELEPEFRKLGATIVLSNDKLDSRRLQSLVKRNIKLIYSNTITNGALQRQFKQLGCPIICHVHELGFSIETFYGKKNLKEVLTTTTTFLAGSQAVAGNLKKQLDLPEERIVVAHPFISAQTNITTLAKMPKPLKLAENVTVVGACGTIGWRKGTDLFLQVARLVLAKTDQPVMFVWVGGPLSHGDYINLSHDAKLMGIDRSVIFTGSTTSHLPYFTQFDIFLLPSREDPFPLVALDAASMGTPIVCFDQAGGTPELVEKDAGIVVPYLDTYQMAEAVQRLIANPSLRKQLGECAQQKVMSQYDTSVGGEHIAKILEKFL